MATTGCRVEIVTPDGAMPGYLVEPEGAEPRSAVLALMEAFGLVPHMERVAERIRCPLQLFFGGEAAAKDAWLKLEAFFARHL